jgi:UDP-glucose 4-epimerase
LSAQPERSVLVTGAHTPLGLALSDALAAHCAVRAVVAVYAPGQNAAVSAGPRVHWVCADLARQRDVHDLFLGAAHAHGIDTVVHMLGHADVPQQGRAATAESGFEQVVLATRTLLMFAEQQPNIQAVIVCSSSDIYHFDSREPMLIDEDQTVELSPRAPQAVRDRAQADLMACAKIGLSRLRIAVLRCAEVLAPGCGSSLYDYLGSRVCLRPLGYDPMINVACAHDVTRAMLLAALAHPQGVFNIPGKDNLPLSELIHRAGRLGVPVPGPALSTLYGLRALTTPARFRYEKERGRFHYGGIPDGHKARAAFGYEPEDSVAFERLFAC